MLAQLLGLLGHVPLKIQFLNILQKIAEQSPEPAADGMYILPILSLLPFLNHVGFIRASVDAAAQYLTLGKTRRALAIFAHAHTAVNDAAAGMISDDVHIRLLLHYAEALVRCGDAKKRYE
jgi:separase